MKKIITEGSNGYYYISTGIINSNTMKTQNIQSKQLCNPVEPALSFPLERFSLKKGREGEISILQRYALKNNGIFQSHERGCNLYYELYGDGPEKLLLMSGLSMNFDAWKRIILLLLRDTRYQICIFCHRGFVYSTSQQKRFTTSMMADDAAALIDHLKWEKVNVAGLSMAGMIILELLMRHSEKLKTVTLMCGAADRFYPPLSNIWRQTAVMFIKDKVKAAKMTAPLNFGEKFLREKVKIVNIEDEPCVVSSPTPEDIQIIENEEKESKTEKVSSSSESSPLLSKSQYDMTGMEYVTQDKYLSPVTHCHISPSLKALCGQICAVMTHFVSVERMHEWRKKWGDGQNDPVGKEKLPKEHHNDKVKVQVVHGSDDRSIPYSHGEHIAKHLGVPFILIPDAGHFLPLERPALIANLIHQIIHS
ncbi:putative alpha/beta hydrolase fold [Monocercomonoides exilis]|uniref:putative alpha/beta hydrolase fold n=1 Tax=Monocercomonoides exilis TaxID=2049356 RepID=UPI00355A460E|nr:putative alpha/beta hydrolase fold [Monocercomonoides exilis]|eukprot:MONOS_1479.1-p1 / transcript=MONOS_1479.1 / gene=MONOS_1479 / organism=Monocercomonoides_exilis_PA203 / gene_product=hydrolase, alpha / transcript_product=hydrolase, alpha / location=Mono_scaffold00026:102504-104089(+) / protein_length=420 / sequence_SO=supercontig / SO=protein_coding / is_pseudo=false